MKNNLSSNRVLIINHLFWPDIVTTARHISELALELSNRNWNVTALVGNRDYRSNKIYNRRIDYWDKIKIIRVHIPKFNQKSNFQRLFTSFWMQIFWIFHLPFLGNFNAIILGTNPPFSYFLVPFIKLFKRNSKIILWSFDLYPEAIHAHTRKKNKYFSKYLFRIVKFCYSKLDVLVDLGECMKAKLNMYNHGVKNLTLTPWSFVESTINNEVNSDIRASLFGDANLTLLYTGTLGNAHEYENILSLARFLRSQKASINFCFAGFGNRYNELKGICNYEDSNIKFASFVDRNEELEDRIAATDIMIVSLKEEWTGISVPSKFFTSIACGKPVLFSGSTDSSISNWIKKYGLGFHLTSDNVIEIAAELIKVSNDRSLIQNMKQNSVLIYHKIFSKRVICDNWSILLHETIKNK